MSSQLLKVIVIILLFIIVVLVGLLMQKPQSSTTVLPDERDLRPAESNQITVPVDQGDSVKEEVVKEDGAVEASGAVSEDKTNGRPAEAAPSSLSYGSATIWIDGEYRYISSDGIPNHETGAFPNPGNPNTISEQDISYRVTLNPVYVGDQIPAHVPGVALNGIPMEPGTAEREGSYNIEALQDTYNLGLDENNAHVQPTGLYHYHGVPEGLINAADQSGGLIQLGWAADGFPMYHSLSHAYVSGYELIAERSDGSTPDGTYTQDFEFTGVGNLDECNGAWIDTDTYAYFLTDEFPYIPRCLNGVPDESFAKGPGAGSSPGEQGGGGALDVQGQPGGGGGNPPAEAITACADKSVGSSCSVQTPQGTLAGNCLTPPNQTQLACVPS